MKTIEHTLSIQQMQKLRLLGIDTTDAHWVKLYYDDEGNIIDWLYLSGDEKSFEMYSEITEVAYTLIVEAEGGAYDHSYRDTNGVYDLQNIMQLMPELYSTINANNERVLDIVKHQDSKEYSPTLYLFRGLWHFGYLGTEFSDEWVVSSADNMLDAAFKALCWLANNNFLKQ